MVVTYEQVRKYIKLSKSESKDNGPYTVEFDTDWYNIFDKTGTVIGQLTKTEYASVTELAYVQGREP